MTRESIDYQISGINNQITDDFGTDNDLRVTGGGRGWTATTTFRGEQVSATATSKLAAAEALYDRFTAGDFTEADADNDPLSDDLDFEGMTEGEAAQCVAECVTSIRPFCECRCDGKNHGAMHGASAPTMLGPKPCKCGCGQTTNRTFVPGHDARYHGLVALREWAEANGQTGTDEELRKAKAAAMRKAARERRAAKRAEVKVKAEAVAKAVQPKRTRRVRPTNQTPKAGIKVRVADDLPF
jgi:hypothetical protein